MKTVCVYSFSLKNAAVSINADCLLISSVLRADGTDYFIPSPHTWKACVTHHAVIFVLAVIVKAWLGLFAPPPPILRAHFGPLKTFCHPAILGQNLWRQMVPLSNEPAGFLLPAPFPTSLQRLMNHFLNSPKLFGRKRPNPRFLHNTWFVSCFKY